MDSKKKRKEKKFCSVNFAFKQHVRQISELGQGDVRSTHRAVLTRVGHRCECVYRTRTYIGKNFYGVQHLIVGRGPNRADIGQHFFYFYFSRLLIKPAEAEAVHYINASMVTRNIRTNLWKLLYAPSREFRLEASIDPLKTVVQFYVSLLVFCQSNVLSSSHRLERISFYLVATALTILDGPFWVYDLFRQAPIRVSYIPLRLSPCVQY